MSVLLSMVKSNFSIPMGNRENQVPKRAPKGFSLYWLRIGVMSDLLSSALMKPNFYSSYIFGSNTWPFQGAASLGKQ